MKTETQKQLHQTLTDMEVIEMKIDGASAFNAKPLIKEYIAKNRKMLALICGAIMEQNA